MSLLSLETLIQPLTSDQVLETFLETLETIGIGARSWRTGGVARSILRVVAASYANYTQLQAEFIRSGFLDYARGGWLTLLARYVYGVERIAATFATGKITLTNTSGAPYPKGAGEVQFRAPGTKKTYRNVSGFTLNAGASLTIDIVANELGTASSAAPGTITELQTVLFGVTVTNAESVVGIEEQDDEDLRQTCRNKLASLSPNGPRGSYAYAVRVAKRLDGSPVNINRSAISRSSSNGTVTVTVASPSGAPVADDITAVRESIEAIARPDSVTVSVAGAVALPVTPAVTVWARRAEGVSAQLVEDAASAALTSAFASYPIGGIAKAPSTQGYLYADYLASQIIASLPSIFDVDGLTMDVALSPFQVANLVSPTFSVRLVEAA